MAAKGAGGLRPLPARGAGKQVTPLPPPVWLAGRGALRPGPPGWRPRGGRAPPPRSDPSPCGRLKPTSCWNRKVAARPTELTAAPPCGRRRPPPGTARRPGHGQQGGRGRPGRPLSPSSSPVFTPLARTLASRSAKVSCRTRSRSHTRLEGASCLCLPLPAPKISVPQEGFPRRNRGFFFLRVGADCLLNFRKTQRTKNENQRKHGWGGVPSCSSADSFACGCSLRACSARVLLRCWGPSRERDRPPPALEKPARHPRNSWLASQPTSEIRGCFG